MNEKNQKTKVYILGAGCSARSGYPLAKEFIPQLEAFSSSLGAGASWLKGCINETITLMRRANVQTVDDLAFRLHNDSFEARTGSPIQDEVRREERIRNAKLAAAALLLSKEAAAKATGLHGYRELLLEMCPGAGDWDQKLRRSNCHVLTFNYDRLFEMTLLDLVGPDLARKGLYDYLLNSGFFASGDRLNFRNEEFSFLKLHGLTGGLVRFEDAEPHYHPVCQGWKIGADIVVSDELFAPFKPEQHRLRTEPLLVFPHEKHHVESGGKHFVYENYLTSVWSKAKEIIADAYEIYVIGYSFAAMDRNSIIGLLAGAKNCKRGIIQNLPGEAERICRMLKTKHPELPVNWGPYPEPF